MIYPAKYNGINFSYDFTRENNLYNFDLQRKKCIINKNKDIGYLSFLTDINVTVEEDCILTAKYVGLDYPDVNIQATSITDLGDTKIVYFFINANTVDRWSNMQFVLKINDEILYSEICNSVDDDDCKIKNIFNVVASNNDDRFGYLSNQAFGFFEIGQFKSDIFINKKTEYVGTYGRKRILKSENQVGKRFIFKNLSMYQQNLLKWLCNCQNLSIDGVSYYLISEFTEIMSDANSEIMSLQADFVETEQSFFGDPSTKQPTNIFTSNFFMK